MIGWSTVINQFLPCFFFKTPDVWWCFGASRVGSHGPNFVRWFTYDLRCDIPQLANSEKLPEGEPVISHDISVKSYLYIQWYLYFLMLKFHVWWFHTACVAPFFWCAKSCPKMPKPLWTDGRSVRPEMMKTSGISLRFHQNLGKSEKILQLDGHLTWNKPD